ncbi:hypothetical protein [Natronorubrum bangense]|uniref:GLUG domain-containing protein n=1 Tax=Natronorubrum bangense JCM 10635 TaxID=1227500 RepID=L9W2T5_9EURY|nr:hypothetical protein [Natronorubrum bangense]ELY42628.1 hypothetical protein C494_20018 [Natronorubrum bangense JCM 10635]
MYRREMLKTTGAGTVLASSGLTAGTATGATGDVSSGLDITFVEADPDAGFNYPYYLYAPPVDDDYERPILVEPNNTGYSSDKLEDHRDVAEDLIEWLSSDLSDPLGVPMLVPVFPRPESDPVNWEHYVHALDVETMQIGSGDLERVDLQLIKMIEDAKAKLADHSVPVADDILMDGFSASGNFVNRFTALHPEMVRSVTAGGINGTAILPLSDAGDHTLNYQVGTADLASLVGEEFDEEAWTETAQLVYMGGDDENDTIPYDDAWNQTQREIALDVYGEHMQEDRMPYCKSVYDEAGATGRVTTYPNIGHRPINSEIVDFHRKRVVPYYIAFATPPAIGATAVQVHALTIESSTYDVRAFDTNGSDITAEPAELDPDGELETTLELTESLAAGEPIEVALLETGQTDPTQALASETAAAAGRVELVETPAAGESEVTVEYELSSSYDPAETPRLRLDTEQGGAAVGPELTPGSTGTETFELSTDANGIPFEQTREIVAKLADDDPYGIDPIAVHTETVGVPDGPVASVETTADPAVRRGEEIAVDAQVRTLGGDPDDLEEATVSFAIDDEVVREETITLELSETRTVSTILETDSDTEVDELAVTASVEGESDETSVVIAEQPALGDGTSEQPYQIETGRELAYVHFELDGYYELASAIDLSGYTSFFSLGHSEGSFSGVFDGTGNEISGLTIDSTADGVGLFSELDDGEIRNLSLIGTTVFGGDFVGGVVGVGNGLGTLSKVRVSGSVNGESYIGGLIGGTMTGENESSEIEIDRVAVDATVAGSNTVGGLLGQSSGDSITNCYSLGHLESSSDVGGLIGHEHFGSTVEESYSAAVFDSSGGGGLIATGDSPSVVDSYWDTETTGQDTSVGGGDGLSTDELTGETVMSELDGFDFDAVWTVTDEYPMLSWESRLEITAVEAPESIDLGDPFGVSVTISNDAGSELDDDVVLTFDGEQIESDPVTLEPGSSKTVEFDVETDDLEFGEYDYLLELDQHSVSRTVNVLSDEPIFDITDIAFSETVVEETDATLAVEVTNFGPKDEQPLTATVETADGEELSTEQIADVSLAQEETYEDTVELDTASLSTGDFELLVETDDTDVTFPFSIVEGSYVEFSEVPTEGDQAVTVNYSASPEIQEDDLRLRVGDDDETEITEYPITAFPGDEEEGVPLQLTRLLEAEESITVVLQPSGGYDPSAAVAAETVAVEQPDGLSISGVSAPSELDLGEPLELTVEVTNHGDDAVDETLTFAFVDTEDEQSISLESDASTTVEFTAETDGLDPGVHEYQLYLAGQTHSETVDLLQTDEPAFEVTDSFVPDQIHDGAELLLPVEVTNFGAADEQAITATITADGEEIRSETLDEVSLETNETWSDHHELDTASLEYGEYLMTVETADATVESAFTVAEVSIELDAQPEAGDTDVVVDCFVSPELETELHARVTDESGADLTDESVVLSPGDDKTGLTIPLVRELEADEAVTSVLVPPGSYDPDRAFSSDTQTVESSGGGGGISLPEPPEDDDSEPDDDPDDEEDSDDQERPDDQDEPDEQDEPEDDGESDDATDDDSSDPGAGDDRERDDGMPGFGIASTLGTIGGLGYLIKRRLEDADEAE